MLKIASQPVSVRNPLAARLPHTYVLFTAKPPDNPFATILAGVATRVRAEGWRYRELATDHFPLLDQPQAVAALLLELAG